MKIFFLTLSILILSTNLFADDLVGHRFSLKRVLVQSDKIAFKLCDSTFLPATCDYIGKPEGYTMNELDDISHSELVEARWKGAGTVVGYIVGAFVALEFGAVALVYDAVYSFVNASTAIGVAASLGSKKTNLFHQEEQAKVLNLQGIHDSLVLNMSDEKVMEISELMREVLE